MSHIFISYSRRDLTFAQKIVDTLAENNLDTWIDWKSIPKGEDWEQEIYRGIEEADAFLFLISPDSVVSQMCNKEIAHAVKNGKRILPVFIANVDDRGIYGVTEKFFQEENKKEISRLNFIKCRDGRDDFNKAIEETLETIHTDYEWLKFHTELQVKALKWEEKKDFSRLLRGKELHEAESRVAAGSGKDPPPTDLQRLYISKSRKFNKTFNSVIVAALIVIAVLVALPGLIMPRAIPGNWVPIPGGEFTMGFNEEEAGMFEHLCAEFYNRINLTNEKCTPVNELLTSSGRQFNAELPEFKIMDNEVTNALYMKCMDDGECIPPKGWSYESVDINKPATGLDWEEATTYCIWLNGRLPTEGEWEKAARGPNQTIFPWGDEWDWLNPKANLENMTDESPLGITAYTASDTNAYHVYNMAGNVMEWTASANIPHTLGSAFANEVLQLKEIGQTRRVIVRGGTWGNPSSSGMASKRGPLPPGLHDVNIGFRCVCPAGQECREPWDWRWIWSHDYYPDQ